MSTSTEIITGNFINDIFKKPQNEQQQNSINTLEIVSPSINLNEKNTYEVKAFLSGLKTSIINSFVKIKDSKYEWENKNVLVNLIAEQVQSI